MNTATVARIKQHTVEVKGLSTFCRATGDPTHPVIVLLHGFPSPSHLFRDLIPLLAARYRVIAPDCIGFGPSAAPTVDPFDHTFDKLTAQVQGLLDPLAVTDAISCMQHDGGPIGRRLATAHPGRVRGLVVQNACAYMEGLTFGGLGSW